MAPCGQPGSRALPPHSPPLQRRVMVDDGCLVEQRLRAEQFVRPPLFGPKSLRVPAGSEGVMEVSDGCG